MRIFSDRLRFLMKFFVTLMMASFLVGCVFPREISGSHVLIEEGLPTAKTSPKDVKIFLEKPKQKYQVVALVTSSATINQYSDVAYVESGLLSELRDQAAQVGADGLVEIVRETLMGGVMISTTEWGAVTKHGGTSYVDPKTIQTRHDQRGSVSQGYILVYKAKAIRRDTATHLGGVAH